MLAKDFEYQKREMIGLLYSDANFAYCVFLHNRSVSLIEYYVTKYFLPK